MNCKNKTIKHRRLTTGIVSFDKKPNEKDTNAVDGVFMFGYRKVRQGNDCGFVFAGGLRFGDEALLNHIGKWVYVDASDYWATTAMIGRHEVSETEIVMGVRCEALD